MDLASTLYKRVDFAWLLNKQTGRLRMGWTRNGSVPHGVEGITTKKPCFTCSDWVAKAIRFGEVLV